MRSKQKIFTDIIPVSSNRFNIIVNGIVSKNDETQKRDHESLYNFKYDFVISRDLI